MMTRLRPLLALVLPLAFTGCGLLADPLEFEREEVPVFRRSTPLPPPDPGDPAQLRVMAWNIKYGAGRIPFWFDCWGDRVSMTRAEVERNLEGLAAMVRELQPDVLLTEEIEVDSRRSAYVDMVRYLLEHTELSYAAFFESWSSGYVPTEGLGRMHLGNAIFSRYPIRFAERIRQEDRTDLDPLTSTFYIHRVVGRAEIELPALAGGAAGAGRRVVALVVHTEAYDLDGTKQRQIAQIEELVEAERLPFVLGGDFNELPPTAVRREGFPDERASAVCSDDFAQPPYTPEVMRPFYDRLSPWIDLVRYGTTEQEQARYYTHSVLGPEEVNDADTPGEWNRTLDYLFVGRDDAWVEGSTDVLQRRGQRVGGEQGLGPVLRGDPLVLSDHAPVFGIWEVRP